MSKAWVAKRSIVMRVILPVNICGACVCGYLDLLVGDIEREKENFNLIYLLYLPL